MFTTYRAAIVDVMNHYLVNSALMSEADKTILGIHPITGRPAHRIVGPDSYPLLRVVNTDFDRHKLQFTDSANPARQGKPAGVAFCEIRYQAGEAPEGPGAAGNQLNVTRSGETLRFDSADRNRTVHYFARWVSSKGQYGPWSPVVSQMIR